MTRTAPHPLKEHIANREQIVYISVPSHRGRGPGRRGIVALPVPQNNAIRNAIMSQAALRLVEGSSMDKTKALDAALSQIERAFGKGSIMRLGKNDKSMD